MNLTNPTFDPDVYNWTGVSGREPPWPKPMPTFQPDRPASPTGVRTANPAPPAGRWWNQNPFRPITVGNPDRRPQEPVMRDQYGMPVRLPKRPTPPAGPTALPLGMPSMALPTQPKPWDSGTASPWSRSRPTPYGGGFR